MPKIVTIRKWEAFPPGKRLNCFPPLRSRDRSVTRWHEPKRSRSIHGATRRAAGDRDTARRRRTCNRCAGEGGGSDEGGQYSFHDVTSRFARNPRFATVGPKIPFIGECTLNGPARIQPFLVPFCGAYPVAPSGFSPRHAAFLHERCSIFRRLQFHIKTLSLRLASRIAFSWPNRSVGWFQFSILHRRKDRAHAIPALTQ